MQRDKLERTTGSQTHTFTLDQIKPKGNYTLSRIASKDLALQLAVRGIYEGETVKLIRKDWGALLVEGNERVFSIRKEEGKLIEVEENMHEGQE